MSTLADARRWRPMGGGIQSVGWHLTSWIKPAVFKHAGYPQFYLYLFFKKKRSLQNYNMFMCRRNANQLRIPPTLRGEGWQQTHQQPGAGVLLIVWVQRGQLLPASSTLGSFFVSVVSSGTASGSKLSCQLVFLQLTLLKQLTHHADVGFDYVLLFQLYILSLVAALRLCLLLACAWDTDPRLSRHLISWHDVHGYHCKRLQTLCLLKGTAEYDMIITALPFSMCFIRLYVFTHLTKDFALASHLYLFSTVKQCVLYSADVFVLFYSCSFWESAFLLCNWHYPTFHSLSSSPTNTLDQRQSLSSVLASLFLARERFISLRKLNKLIFRC